MIGPKHDDGANDGDQHTVEIEAGDAGRTDGCEQEPADHGANDDKHDVEQQSLTRAREDVTGDKARNQRTDIESHPSVLVSQS